MLVTEGLHEDAGHRWLINERLATSVKLKVRKIQVENLNKASKNIIVLYNIACQQICNCSMANFLSREVTWQATTKRTKNAKIWGPR